MSSLKDTVKRLDMFRPFHDNIDEAINFLVSLISLEPRINMPEVDSLRYSGQLTFTWEDFIIIIDKPKRYYLNGTELPELKSLKEIIQYV